MARPFVKLSDSFSLLRDKVNTISYNVGDPDNLNTYLDSDVVAAINEIENVFDASSGEILYPTGGAGETQTRLLISTAQSGGTDVQFNVGANFNVNAVGDINLDAGGSNINFLDDSVTRLAYTLGSTNSLDVTGAYDVNVAGLYDLTATGLMNLTSGGNFTSTVTGNVLFDASQDITLDAGGNNVVLKGNGTTRFDYSLGTTNTVTVTGDYNVSVSDSASLLITNGYLQDVGGLMRTEVGSTKHTFVTGAMGDSADSYSLFTTDNISQRSSHGSITQSAATGITLDAGGDIVIDAGGGDIDFKDDGVTRFAYGMGDSNTLDVTGNLTRTVSGNLSDSANGTYHIGATGNTNITAGGTFVTTTGAQTHTVTGDVTFDASGDIILDADGGDIDFKDNGVSRFAYGMGDSNTLDVTGNLSQIVSSNWTDSAVGYRSIGSTGSLSLTSASGITTKSSGAQTHRAENGIYTIVASDDVNITAGGNNFRLKNNAGDRFVYNFGTNQEIDVTGSLTYDVAGDIVLDADGGNIDLKDGGVSRFEYGLGASNTLAVTGNLTQTVSGNFSDSANGTYHVGSTGNMDVRTYGTYVLRSNGTLITTSASQTHNVTGTHTTDVSSNATRTVGGNVSDSANGTYHIGATGATDITTLGTFSTTSMSQTHDVTGIVTVTVSGDHSDSAGGTRDISATDGINIDTRGPMTNTAGGAFNLVTEGSFGITADGQINVTGDLDITLSAGTKNVIFKDSSLEKIRFNLDSDQVLEFKNSLVLDADHDITLEANGKDIHFNDGTQNNFTFNLGPNQEIDVVGNLTFDVNGDIILDANGADNILKDNAVEYGRFTNSGNNLFIKSGNDSDALQFTANTAVFHKALFTDSALGTNASNVAGGINELENVLRGINASYSLETTSQNVRDAINELSRELYDSGSSFVGLSAISFKGAAEELRVELGNHLSLTTFTDSSAVAAINELDGEIGDSDISSIALINTVKGALRQLHTEVGSLSLTVRDSEGGNTVTVTDLTTAANKLDERLDIIEAWTNQDVQTSASPTFNQVTASKVNYSSNFILDIEGDINLDANGGDIFLKDNGVQFGRLLNSSNQLDIYSGTTLAIEMDASKVEIHGRAFYLDSALDTSVQNVAGAINELHTDIVNNDSDIAELDTRVGKLYNLDSGTAGGFFSTASINNDNIVNALNELASRAVLIYDENGTLLN